MSETKNPPTSYPAVGDIVTHAMERNNEPWKVIAVHPHSDPRKTQQRAVSLRGKWSQRERTFEMSVKNFWFNWVPDEGTEATE